MATGIVMRHQEGKEETDSKRLLPERSMQSVSGVAQSMALGGGEYAPKRVQPQDAGVNWVPETIKSNPFHYVNKHKLSFYYGLDAEDSMVSRNTMDPALNHDTQLTSGETESMDQSCMSISHSVISNSLQCHGLQLARLLCPWNSPGKNTGMSCHFLLQEIFQTQGLNPGHLHCRQILYHLRHQETHQS